jgi:hypothetical protein
MILQTRQFHYLIFTLESYKTKLYHKIRIYLSISMKVQISVIIVFCGFVLSSSVYGQGFDCTGDFYLSIYSESKGRTELYELIKDQSDVVIREILLSEARQLTGLAYHADDGHLWSIDITDGFDMVRINSDGKVESMGRIYGLDGNSYTDQACYHPKD